MVVEQLYRAVPGGIGEYAFEMAARLPRLAAPDDEVWGVSAWHRRPPGRPLPLPARRVPLPSRPLTAAWQFLRLPRLRGADVVLATSLAVPPTGRATGLVVFCADLAFLHVPEAFPRWGLAFHRRGLRNAVRHADMVLTCSQTSAVDLAAAGAADVRVIPLGADPPAIDAAEALRRRQALGVPDAYVLALSTNEPRKNLSTVVAAAPRLPAPLVVAGPTGWLAHDVKADGVIAVGHVGPEDRSALYMGALALCYPSLYEGFGLPVVEAMAHGTPVVTSTVSSLPEVAGDAGVLIEPTDVDALVDAVDRLAHDDGFRAERVEKGLQQATRYTWEASAHATWNALVDVNGLRRGAA